MPTLALEVFRSSLAADLRRRGSEVAVKIDDTILKAFISITELQLRDRRAAHFQLSIFVPYTKKSRVPVNEIKVTTVTVVEYEG